MGRKLDLTGRVYGLLTVLRENGHIGVKVAWLCKCRCGKEITVTCNNLQRGNTRSCGCLHDEMASKRQRKHGLHVDSPRLLNSVTLHFAHIKNAKGCYRYWTLDPRYSNDTDGAIKFCMDVITIYPDSCALYEQDKNLELDKDNCVDHVFRPEIIRFVSRLENANNKRTTRRLSDGTPFTDFCRKVGVETVIHGHVTKQYSKYHAWFKKHDGEGHPELVRKANDLVSLYSKCLKLLRLRDEVYEFKRRLAQMQSCS